MEEENPTKENSIIQTKAAEKQKEKATSEMTKVEVHTIPKDILRDRGTIIFHFRVG